MIYKTLIIEPQNFSLHSLLTLPIWGENKSGFVCTHTASNGEQALEILRDNNIDLVLTEINLPLLDGLALLKKVYCDGKPPLVVFISDIVSFSYTREGFIYGAFDYLPKPVTKETMISLFKRVRSKLQQLQSSSKQPDVIFASAQSDYIDKARLIGEGIVNRNIEVLSQFKILSKSLYMSQTNI